MFIHKIIGLIACDPKGVIAKEGRLPWSYPEDLKHFYAESLNNVMIMGYKTFISMPQKAFENRISIVFSKHHKCVERNNIIFVVSLEAFLNLNNLPANKKYLMIGGSEITRLFLDHNLIDEFILTEIYKEYDGDVYIPLDEIKKWPVTCIRKTNDFVINRYKNAHKCS